MAAEIILGTVQFGLNYGINNKDGKPSQKEVNLILEQAFAAGIKKLDTAEAYGTAQSVIGNYHLSHPPFQIDTKFKKSGQSGLRAELKKTLNNLHVDHIDTYFYHSFSDFAAYPEILDELMELKKEGLITKIGVSVYSNEEMDSSSVNQAVDVIQLPFNLLDNIFQRRESLHKAKQHGKLIQVRSVFLQGLFFRDPATLPEFLLPLKPWLEKLRDIAMKANIPMEALCLQYVNAQPWIDEIILGVDSKNHLLNNLKVLGGKLEAAIVEMIDGVRVTETALLYPYNWK